MPPKSNRKVPADLTPSVGAATDFAPLSQNTKPAHELKATEDAQLVNWDEVANLEEFRTLVKTKVKFVTSATVFFVVFYFALPALVGYAPELMSKKVFGVVNVAYLFALSQFAMAWVIAWLYVRAAGRFDKMAATILSKLKLK